MSSILSIATGYKLKEYTIEAKISCRCLQKYSYLNVCNVHHFFKEYIENILAMCLKISAISF